MAKILLVEDEVSMSHVLSERLQAEGYQVTVADEAEKALEILKTNDTDLIIVDLRLPGITGLEMLDAMREDEAIEHERIRVVVLTNVDDQIVQKYVAAKDYDYLIKTENSLDDIASFVATRLAKT